MSAASLSLPVNEKTNRIEGEKGREGGGGETGRGKRLGEKCGKTRIGGKGGRWRGNKYRKEAGREGWEEAERGKGRKEGKRDRDKGGKGKKRE